LNGAPQLGVAVGLENSGSPIQVAVTQANVNGRILLNIPDPTGFMVVFGKDIEMAVVKNKPDFDSSGQSGDSAGCGQVENLEVGKLVEVWHGFWPATRIIWVRAYFFLKKNINIFER